MGLLAASLRRACDGQYDKRFAKSPPTASKTFGLRPNWNPPRAGNNTGASRLTTGALLPEKELDYGEHNVRSSAELKPAYDGQQHKPD